MRLFLIFLMLAAAAISKETIAAEQVDKAPWTATFSCHACKSFMTKGRGRYFVLEPGYEQIFEGTEDGKATRLVISVTKTIKKVGGIEARVVSEVETIDGQISESTRDYFAICRDNGSLLYLGEEVDHFENGKPKGHQGSWRHGEKGARFGVMLPGKPAMGQKYCQEEAPEVGMDRAEIVGLREEIKTPAGVFKNCLRTLESSPLEPGHSETKAYAPEIGQVADGPLLLVKHGFKATK